MSVVELVRPTSTFSKSPYAHEFGQKIVRASRVIYLTAILIFILLMQTAQATFINADVLMPIYFLLSFSFLINSLYLIFYEKLHLKSLASAAMFALDTLVITGFNYYSQSNYTIFMILYLLNIVLCGLRFETEGAVILALWTSLLFSGLLIVGPQLTGQNFYISIILNNFSFFALAYLSGGVSERILLLKKEIETRDKDLVNLQKLNEMIINNVANGLVSVDTKWRISQFNKSAEKILGVPLEKKTLKEVLFQKFDEVEKSLPDPVSGEVKRIELNMETRGRKKTLEVIISLLIDSNLEPKGYVLLLQDLTKLKELEAELRQKDKLAAVGQLAAGIAHEIRNPLASISGSIQLLASGGIDQPEEGKKLMAISVKEIDRLNNLISEFLEYVKPEKQGQDVIDINAVVKELMSMVKMNDRLNKGVEQTMNLNANKMVVGNTSKIKQALLNIIINAYQAMEKSKEGTISVSTFDNNDSITLTIRDTGVGMSENSIDKIFEPFHTTKASGTGLGLAITHKILEGHGARVNVESQEGRGTTFLIEFMVDENPLGTEMKLQKQA